MSFYLGPFETSCMELFIEKGYKLLGVTHFCRKAASWMLARGLNTSRHLYKSIDNKRIVSDETYFREKTFPQNMINITLLRYLGDVAILRRF